MKARRNSKSGQTMVEYIIIVVIVAVSAIGVFGIFGDTIRQKVSGIVAALDDGDLASDAQAAATDDPSKDWLTGLGADGSGS
jgi:Flp pilus assembly pilin Flp